jgi:hypothetical protein
MVTMVDELYDRHYRESRAELNAVLARVIARLGAAVRNAFEVLNRIEYSAPWANKPRGANFR